jgi:hypothetical protein
MWEKTFTIDLATALMLIGAGYFFGFSTARKLFRAKMMMFVLVLFIAGAYFLLQG